MTAIAIWSGPRNISTALMRSWEARGDAAVVDEPLYAAYLDATGLEHPGRAEILAAHERDWRRVVATLTGPVPGGKAIYYQKHMAHHLLPEMDDTWVLALRNALLLREPREMLVSLAKVIPEPRVEDTGLPQQERLLALLLDRTGAAPPVIDARDVLADPARMLAALCARLEVPWTERMLAWEPGRRATDGAWAQHWYDAVERSTGFAPWRPREEPVPARLGSVLEECEAIYARLAEHRMTG